MISTCRTSFVLLLALALALVACDEMTPITIENQNDNQGQADANSSSSSNQGNNQQDDAGFEDDANGSTDPDDTGSNQNNGNNTTPSGPAIDGEACTQDSDCISNTCLTSADWPDGYCTTIHCDTFEDCANDDTSNNACLINPSGPNFCVRLCDPTTGEPCREDYQCQALSSGDGWCAGDPDDGGSGDPAEIDFDIECVAVSGQQAQFDYEVSSDTDSYMVVPLTGNGEVLSPMRIDTPSGQVIDFQGANYFQAVGAQLFGSVNPTVIPAVPQFAGQMESGTHTYTLYTNDSQMCYYLLEDPGNSTIIDLNLYLVGLPGISASNAATNSNLQAVIMRAQNIYNQAGISFGDVRYYDVPSDVEQAYQDIHSESDIRQLVSNSVNPEDDGGSAISANIFITRSFQMGGALGLSLGIPGVAGLHGTGISGVAMTGEYIGSSQGNSLTGNVLAHELGHFLGLFHTSETNGQTHDPLNDTPECTNFSNMTNCPDWGNLMFPSADFNNDELTPDQSFVLSVNPLTR